MGGGEKEEEVNKGRERERGSTHIYTLYIENVHGQGTRHCKI